jgi:hypothetical protein
MAIGNLLKFIGIKQNMLKRHLEKHVVKVKQHAEKVKTHMYKHHKKYFCGIFG